MYRGSLFLFAFLAFGCGAPSYESDAPIEIVLSPRLSAENREALDEAVRDWNVGIAGCAEITIGTGGLPIAEAELSGSRNGEWSDGVLWIEKEPMSYRLTRITLAHEIGHALGIEGHLEDRDCIMSEFGAVSLCPQDVIEARRALGCD